MNDTNYTYTTLVKVGVAKVVTPGTAVQFNASSFPCRVIKIKARTTNTGDVLIGDANVLASTGVGYSLAPGESVDIRIDDVNKLYADAANANDLVGYVALA